MDEISEIIQKMTVNEDKIMLLYWEYAKAFPLFKNFWNSLAEEEKEHAHMLRGIGALVDGKETRAEMGKASPGIVEASIQFIDAEIKKTQGNKGGSDEAFAMALKIEKSMLENDVFSFFSSKDKKVQALLDRLRDDTQRHYDSLKRAIDSMI